METVRYSAFGAKGDGKTDDMAAIIAAHAYANEHALPVRADEGAVYYIGDADAGAVVKTDTDWTGASFILDDLAVNPENTNRSVCIFNVEPSGEPYMLEEFPVSLPRSAENLGIRLPTESIVVLNDENTRRYIRKGKNANKGTVQTDVVIADREGNIDMRAPLIWNFETVTSMQVIPMDETPLTLRGGTFTTIANAQPSGTGYYSRGIRIRRANVTMENVTHYMEREEEEGSAYSGILICQDCANLTVRDCLFTAHKTYRNNRKGLGMVSQGTYDISLRRSINVTLDRCRQTTDILDTAHWGIMGSNFCKNIHVKDCVLSRFDAHQGVANVTITGSTLGWQCLEAIGTGVLKIEGTTLYGRNIINLRSDYGGHWEGEAVIRDCTWIPAYGQPFDKLLPAIGGSNAEDFDFGYECFMPHTVYIENLTVDDSRAEEGGGVCLFGTFNSSHKDEESEEKILREGFPYRVTERVIIKNLRTASGKKPVIAANPFMFRHMQAEEISE